MTSSSHVSTQKKAASAADVRFIGDLPGCYVLSSRESLNDDRVKAFACRARSISPQKVVVQAPVRGEAGEPVALRFDDIGLIRGRVSRTTSDGFAVDLQASEAEQAALASRIDWLKRKWLQSLPDRRQSKRWLPRDPRSMLVLGGSKTLECFIINVSCSGVAVSADLLPQIGMPLAVGTLPGRVVRRLEYGFAVQFAVEQNPEAVESMLTALLPGRREAIVRALAAEAGSSL
jgi:hypothetical protein